MSRILYSIPLKICLSILLIEAVMLACTGGFYWYRFAREIDASTAEKLALPAALISEGILDHTVVQNLPTLSGLLKTEVLDAFVVHQNGTVMVAATHGAAGKYYLSLLEPREREAFGERKNPGGQVEFTSPRGERVISTLIPLTLPDPNISGLYLRIDGSRPAAAKSGIIRLLFFGALGVIAVTVFLEAMIVNRLVVRRIRTTSAVLGRIAEGDFSARIINDGAPDQLGAMIEQVNVMISAIERYTGQLRSLNAAADQFAHAGSKEQVIRQAVELIEQQLPVRCTDPALNRRPGESSERSNNGDTVFTLPVADNDRNYQVLAFVATDAYRQLDAVERNFVATLSRLVTVAIDRVEAFEELTEAEARYRQLFTSAFEGILRVSPEGRILHANPAMAAMVGYGSAEELVEQISDIGTQLYMHPPDRDKVRRILESEEKIQDYEVTLRRRDGRALPVALSGYALRSDNGELEEFDVRIFDITERKRREQAERDRLAAETLSVATSKLVDDLEMKNRQLLEALKELKAAQVQLMQSERMAAVGMTAAGVAHELNNILSGLINYPELLLAQLPEDSEMHEMVKAISASGKRAAVVVGDLLALTEEDGAVKQRVRLESLVDDCLRGFEYSQLIASYPEVEVRVRHDSEATYLRCTPRHIQKAILNLVLHAAEAGSKKGTIVVRTAFTPVYRGRYASGKDIIQPLAGITVTYEGPKIPVQHQKHIFEPFFINTVMGGGGTGLALTVVWNVVYEHGGQVEVESSDSATTFSLSFPAEQGEESAGSEPRADNLELRGTGRILVIDDEPLQQDIARRMLLRYGYDVDVCGSGEEAVAFLENEKVDLLLVDMLMPPGIDGLQTYERILKMHPGQKAIVVSGYAENTDVKRVMQLGAGAFIRKPYSIYQMAQIVKKELATNQFGTEHQG